QGEPCTVTPARQESSECKRPCEEVSYQKLRDERLAAETQARVAFEAGNTEQALQILSAFLDKLHAVALDYERMALLSRPVEEKLNQYRISKAEQDLNNNNEPCKQEEIARLLKEAGPLLEQRKYSELEVILKQAKELDP